MTPPGLVSTVIPVFNRPQAVVRAVRSVLSQDWEPKEIVLVDDGSDDGSTQEALRTLASENPAVIRVVTQANAGPGAARERGRQLATGEFIQYLDSDDILLPGKFSRQVAALNRMPDAGIAYGLTLDKQGQPTHGTEDAHARMYPALAAGRIWATPSPLYRRAVCDAIGPWSSSRILEDWDYECRAGVLGIKLVYCGEPVAQVIGDAGTRAGRAWEQDARAMGDRASAHVRALRYALAAGVDPHAPEMRRLVRSMFWMAREAAAQGLPAPARELFELARAHSVERPLGFALFRLGASVIGWKNASRFASALASARIGLHRAPFK